MEAEDADFKKCLLVLIGLSGLAARMDGTAAPSYRLGAKGGRKRILYLEC